MQLKTVLEQFTEYQQSVSGTLSLHEWIAAGKFDRSLLKDQGDLTKNYFWMEIEKRWPGIFGHFNVWLNEYMAANDWKAIFNSDSNWQDSNGKNAPVPSYYQLPTAMQLGIFMQFCMEESHRYEFIEGMPKTMAAMVDDMHEWFCEEEDAALREHQESKIDAYDFSAE